MSEMQKVGEITVPVLDATHKLFLHTEGGTAVMDGVEVKFSIIVPDGSLWVRFPDGRSLVVATQDLIVALFGFVKEVGNG